MVLNALIDDKYLLYSDDGVMYASDIENNELSPSLVDLIIEIIRVIKSGKKSFINRGFEDDKKVIMDLNSETLYYYEFDSNYKETNCIIPLFISRLIMGKRVFIFNDLPNTFSKNYKKFEGEIPSYSGFPSNELLYDVMSNLINEEKNIVEDEDYIDFHYKYEKLHLKLILEIISPSIFLEAYNTNFDKFIILELNKYLSIEETYLLLRLNNIDLIKKLYLKVKNMDIKKDLICMALINSIHNKIEVEKYYFEKSLVSEYAYLNKGGKLIILHDQNRFI